jgi:hypothetical protein
VAAQVRFSKTNDGWLDIADIINGVIVRADGTLARVIEVHPLNLELLPTDEVATLLDTWRGLAKEHGHPVDIRLSTRPQQAADYRARLRARADTLEAAGRTPQHQRFAALIRHHERWLADSVLPASRQRHIHWWPWVDPLGDRSLPGRGRAAAATVEQFHAGVTRLDEQVARVGALLRALKVPHRTLEHEEVCAYLHAETHPR